MMKLRVLQTSDWHLGAGVLPAGHGFDDSIRKTREEEEEQLLDRIVRIAKEENVELVLLPGDLWDQEVIAFSLARKVISALGSLSPIPVILLPGNHDFLGRDSFYREEAASRFGAVWPENVTVVRSTEFVSFRRPELADVGFTAKATGANVRVDDRELRNPPPKSAAKINILLYHGSRLHAGLEATLNRGKLTAPFTDEELLSAGFDYVALGHYHTFSTVQDEQGVIRAAYSGEPFARDFASDSAKGVLIFDLEEGGIPPGRMRFIPTDSRRYRRVQVSLTGAADEGEALSRILKALREQDVGEMDLVRVKLHGAYGRGSSWRPTFDLDGAAAGVELDTSRLRPAFDLERALEQAATGSVQAKFLREMAKLLAEAGESDAEARARISLAARLGFEAFAGETIELRPDIAPPPLDEVEGENEPEEGGVGAST